VRQFEGPASLGIVQELGIKQLRWRQTIADYLDQNYDELVRAADGASTSGSAAADAGNVTFCIEGNIGAGKSTWLQMAKQGYENLADYRSDIHEMVEVVPEPVEEWQNVSGKDINLLELFYKDAKRYAFAFQQYVLVTRMRKVRRSHGQWHAMWRASVLACEWNRERVRIGHTLAIKLDD
jgi:Deoxynucleoside kinase